MRAEALLVEVAAEAQALGVDWRERFGMRLGTAEKA